MACPPPAEPEPGPDPVEDAGPGVCVEDEDGVPCGTDRCPDHDDRPDLDDNGTPDCAENLFPLDDAQLRVDLGDWESANSATGSSIERIGDDALENPGSGSLRVNNDGPNALAGAGHCINGFVPSQDYAFGFSYRLPSEGNSEAPAALVRLVIHPGRDCAAGLLDFTDTPSATGELDVWHDVGFTFRTPDTDEPELSVKVLPRAVKLPAESHGETHYDNFLLTTTVIVPEPDAGPDDAGAPPVDAGAPPDDAGAPPVDAGAPPDDAGAPDDDAGPLVDGGVVKPDAGPPPPFDAGPPEPCELDGDGIPCPEDVCPLHDDRVDIDADLAPDCTETLFPLDDAQLRLGLGAWTSPNEQTGGFVEFLADDDALGNSASGALRVQNAGPNAVTGAGYCVDGLEPDRDYQLGFHYKIPPQGSQVARARVRLVWFDGAGCGQPSLGFTDTPDFQDADGAWHGETFTFTLPPGPALSLFVLPRAVKDPTDPEGIIHYDNFLLEAQ